MASLGMTFDSSTVEVRNDFSPLPPGPQNLMITSSELKQTSKGGEMIVLEIDVVDGEHQGRKLFERLNIKNDNQKAVDIAFRTLAEIVKAVGKTTIKDTEELHNKRFVGVLSVEPAKPYTDKDGNQQAGSPQNSIKKFLPYGGAVSTPKATSPAATVESKPNEGAALAPWLRNKG